MKLDFRQLSTKDKDDESPMSTPRDEDLVNMDTQRSGSELNEGIMCVTVANLKTGNKHSTFNRVKVGTFKSILLIVKI